MSLRKGLTGNVKFWNPFFCKKKACFFLILCFKIKVFLNCYYVMAVKFHLFKKKVIIFIISWMRWGHSYVTVKNIFWIENFARTTLTFKFFCKKLFFSYLSLNYDVCHIDNDWMKIYQVETSLKFNFLYEDQPLVS